MSVYNPSIPAATDIPADSQGQIQSNFTKLNTDFQVDHTAFDASSNPGQHKKVTIQNVVGDPNLASPIASIYTKTINSLSELFFQNNTTAADVVQLTGLELQSPDFTNTGTAGGTGNWFDTPWGFRFSFGQADAFSANGTIIFPFGWQTAFVRQATSRGAGNAIGVVDGFTTTTITNDTITLNSPNSIGVNWFFIGTV